MRGLLFSLALLGACSPAKPPEAPPAATPENLVAAPAPTDAWIGTWIGVEGNFLTIEATGVKGAYAITEATLDGAKTYAGAAEGDHITFTLGGKSQKIRAASGADTGLKWLADKTNCLVIESGRGFCR